MAGTGEWTLGMNKANLRTSVHPNRREENGGQIGEQSMLRRRQIVAIHLVQSGSDEIMVRCNGPRGAEWSGQFSRNGQRGGEGSHHIAQPRGKLDIL